MRPRFLTAVVALAPLILSPFFLSSCRAPKEPSQYQRPIAELSCPGYSREAKFSPAITETWYFAPNELDVFDRLPGLIEAIEAESGPTGIPNNGYFIAERSILDESERGSLDEYWVHVEDGRTTVVIKIRYVSQMGHYISAIRWCV